MVEGKFLNNGAKNKTPYKGERKGKYAVEPKAVMIEKSHEPCEVARDKGNENEQYMGDERPCRNASLIPDYNWVIVGNFKLLPLGKI